MENVITNQFSGVMTPELTTDRVVSPNYIDAIGIRNGIGSSQGAATVMLGNEEITFDLPAGENKCILAIEDKENNRLIFLVWNEFARHAIYGTDGSSVQLLASGEALGFFGTPAHGFIVGSTLYWTDGRLVGNELIAGTPRSLDLDRSRQDKFLEYNLYVGNLFNGTTVTVQYILSGSTETLNIPIPSDMSGDVALDFISDALVATGHFNAEACGTCHIKVSVNVQSGLVDRTDTTNNQVFFEPANHFHELQEFTTDYIKWAPVYGPDAVPVVDTSRSFNNIYGKTLQFRYRYIYKGGEKSAFSPISNIPLPLDNLGVGLRNFNAISVSFNDDRLEDPLFRACIKSVELVFREGNDGLFKSIDTLSGCNILPWNLTYRFFNDRQYIPVPSDEDVPDGALQALKLFDNVFKQCLTVSTVADENGNNRAFIASGTEGMDLPDCPVVEYSITEETGDDCLIDIIGTVELYNRDHSALPSDVTTLTSDVQFPDKVLGGFVVYLAGTNYYAISDNPNDGTGDGSFRIRGVPKGVYTLRVASYKCRYDNEMGSIYNLNNGLEWQKTSAPVLEVAGAGTSFRERFERFIDLTGFSSPEFDLDTEAGYGAIKIENFRAGEDDFGSVEIYARFSESYIYDGGTIVVSKLRASTQMELQKVIVRVQESLGIGADIQYYCEGTEIIGGGITDPICYMTTDHNGYAFGTFENGTDPLEWQVTTARLKSWKDSSGADAFTTAIDTIPDKYGLLLDEGSDAPVATINLEATFVLDPQPDGTWTGWDNDIQYTRTKVEGIAIDTNGQPIYNSNVVFGRTGRYGRVGIDGSFAVMVFAPWWDGLREDKLQYTWLSDVCHASTYTYLPSTVTNDVDLSFQMGSGTGEFSIENTNGGHDWSVEIDDSVIAFGKYLKAGENYKLGMIYSDNPGRVSTTMKLPDLYIPFHTEAGFYGKSLVEIDIHHLPPNGSKWYQVVRSKGGVYSSYLQWAIEEIKYMVIPDVDSVPTGTTYNNADATHLFIKVPNAVYLPSELPEGTASFFYRGNTGTGYSPEYKDRIRFILKEDGNLVAPAGILESEVVASYIDVDGVYAVIENPYLGFELKPGAIIEFLKPKQDQDSIYYECGQWHPVIEDGGNLYHGGMEQDQDAGQPAIIRLRGGDTYWRRRAFPVDAPNENTTRITENIDWDDEYPTTHEDIGRPNIYQEGASLKYERSRIRFSDAFAQGTTLNGLSSFRGLSYKDVNADFGAITVLAPVGSVLLAICQYKLQPIYVGKDRIMDLSGASSVGRSDRILNMAEETRRDWGTQHPESVVIEDGRVYAMDARKGLFWRYSQNGQQRITDGISSIIQQATQGLTSENTIPAGFERIYGTYIVGAGESVFSFRESVDGSMVEPGWNTRWPAGGETYGRVGQLFVSFRQGRLYIHDSGPEMEFYGEQYQARITFVVSPGAQFWPKRCRYVAPGGKWEVSNVEMLAIPQRPDQSSWIPGNKFINYEGAYKADFMRNADDVRFSSITDPVTRRATAAVNGAPLKGVYMLVTITPYQSQQASIERFDTAVEISTKTM